MPKLKLIIIACALLLTMAGCTTKKDLTENATLPDEYVPITKFSKDDSEKSDRNISSDSLSGITKKRLSNPDAPPAGSQQDLAINVGDRVFFDYDQYDLRSAALATVEKQARWLKQYPNVNIIIEGHCDERGTREYNLALGEKRAMAVRNYLVALGVSPNRIEIVSYGKERPVALGSNPSAWSQNRRAVIVIK